MEWAERLMAPYPYPHFLSHLLNRGGPDIIQFFMLHAYLKYKFDTFGTATFDTSDTHYAVFR